MATSPETHPELYKSLIVGGVASPGTVTLKQCAREHRLANKPPEGATGAVQSSKGPALVEFEAEFYLADLEDVAGWDDFQATLSASVEAAKPKALSIYHPDLARLKITECVVKSIGILQYDGKGGATATCKFSEFKPVKKRPVVNPEAKKKAAANDPNAARKAELAALLEQAKHP